MSIKNRVITELDTRKEIYITSPSDMIAAYNREVETEKEYNGRQLLELLQNADDEKSDEVQIELNTSKNLLIISNRGESCEAFSFEGIQSLMISNLSSKTTKKFIGNKGLGFRSVINWSEQITINSNNLDIIFSRVIVENVYDELFTVEEHEKFIKERNLPRKIKPIPFLSIPKVIENSQNSWTTRIIIKYKSEFLDDIQKQISDLRDEILLFLNFIKKLNVIVDGKVQKQMNKDLLTEKWKIFQKSEMLPVELWDKENEKEYYDLKIALQDNLNNDIKELFSYFPTKIDISLPFIVHGTFELNSSRNELNDSPKNRFILEKLVQLLISTAKDITQDEVSYKALEILSYTHKNNILDELGFYDAIDDAIEELDVFPCLDGKYRKKCDVIYSDELSVFIQRTQFIDLFPNLLIPHDYSVDLDQYNISGYIDDNTINKLSSNIDTIEDRVELIYLLHKNFTIENQLVFLLDSQGELISLEDDVYTPSKLDISIPDYINIKFMHQELFEKLLIKFGISSNEKARDLQRILKEITNIQSYEPAQVLQKIVTSTNKELAKEGVDHVEIVKKMVQSLYKNYIQLDKTRISSETKIQLLNQENTITDAKNLFLSKTYPLGKLTDYLFGDIFSANEFLADMSTYGFKDDDKEDDIEQFFLWLGVNRISKLTPASMNERRSYCGHFFYFIKGKPDYADHMSLSFARKIYNLEEIANQISLEKFIIWCIKDKNIYDSFDGREYVDLRGSRGGRINSRYCDVSYIHYQLLRLNMFKDYLIGNERLSSLINNISFDFNYEKFETYNINRADVDSMLLKLGAVDKFEKLTINAVNRIVKELPNKSQKGKHAEGIYKLCIKHYEQNKIPLDSNNVMLFAKRGDEEKYFDSKDVFYSGSKLPRKIVSTKAVLDYPGRSNATSIINFFGIKNLKSININITNQVISKVLTKEFMVRLAQLKEYILVYKIKDSHADSTVNAALNKLKNLKILLCENVQYQIDGNSFELDNNDYIQFEGSYLIKVNSNLTLDELQNKFEFQESFADIIGLVFDIQDTKVFRDMLKEDNTYIEKTIRNDIGSDELIRARELFGISDEYYSFWKTIYTLLDRKYTFASREKVLDLVIEDLKLKTDIKYIDFSHLDTYESCRYIQQLFEETGLDIEKFNNSETSYYKIDFTQFHLRNIKQTFDDKLMSFKRYLYTWCIENGKEKYFIDSIGIYNHNEEYIYEQANEFKYETNVDYYEIVDSFINNNFEVSKYASTNIDFEAIYNKNIENINIDAINGNTEYLSLLYFENKLQQIKDYIVSESTSDKERDIENKDPGVTKPIVNISVSSPPFIQPAKRKSKKTYKHSDGSERRKKEIGNKSEKDVYDSLVVQYGKNSVIWDSKDDDGLGYDIRYKNCDGEWRYVEVKTYSKNMFYLTKNEKEFAQKNIGLYEIFLVGDTIHRITDVDFYNENKFLLVANEYIVTYKFEI